jgi:hypothetical protein
LALVMDRTAFFFRIVFAAILFAGIATPARSGGDDYDAMNDTEGKGPAYFGFVRDNRGLPIQGAEVTLSAKGRDPLVLKSNVLGLYRSHYSKEVQPEDVELSCAKQGYKQSDVRLRAPAGTKAMNIEINCTLQRQ